MHKLSLNIAIVGDDDRVKELFFESFSHLDLNIHLLCYNNGLELTGSMRRANAQVPDVIFKKLHQPIQKGLKCITDIRNELSLQRAVLVVHSPCATEAEVELAFVARANIFMKTPENSEELSHNIEDILKLALQYKHSDFSVDTLLLKM